MPRFKKRPVVIEAERFIPELGLRPEGVYADPASPTGYAIGTLEGHHEVTPGDWIITGVAGEKYPCKDTIFHATYDPAE